MRLTLILILSLIASSALGLSCSDDLVGHFYSDCINGFRTAIYYYTQPCDSDGHQLPPSKAGLSCDTSCSPGQNLPFGGSSCQNCNLGEYSIGSGEIYDSWDTIPSTFSTNCVGKSCNVWSPQGSFISSGDNQGKNGIATFLKFRGKFIKSSGNKIRFTYRVDAESCKGIFCDGITFYIDDVKQMQASHVLKWTTVEFDVTPGIHTFQWTFEKDVSFDQGEDLAAIRSVEFIGTQLSTESCAKCPAGFKSGTIGSSGCEECDYNTYSESGSSTCQPCQAGQSSLKGSSSCTELPICSESSYYKIVNDCNPSTLQRSVTHAYWLGSPKVPYCYPPNGVPPADESVACSCPRGKELNSATGKCEYCPSGYYKSSEGLGKCVICPAKNSATKSLYFSEWSKLPSEMKTSCEGDCETDGWIPLGDKIVPTKNKGEINSILSFDFEISSEVSWIQIAYSHSCISRYECNLRLFIDKDTEDPDSFNLPSSTQEYTVPLKKGNYSAMLQYTHFSATKYAKVDVKSILIYGTSQGGAVSCDPCLSGSEAKEDGSTQCILCNPGFYNPNNGSDCISVPEGAYAENYGMTTYEMCGVNTVSNKTHCLTDCKFDPKVTGISKIVYDLSPLNDPVNMHFAGAESTGLSYYLNICQRQSKDGFCYGLNGVPLNTFGCQRIVGQQEAVDIGHTIGFLPLQPADLGVPDSENVVDKGLVVTLTGGKYGCRNSTGFGVSRQTDIIMICDVRAGIGSPEPRGYTAETGYRSCNYKFIWKSLYACPLCTVEDYSIVTSDCINGKQTITHVKTRDCWDPQPPPNEFLLCRACPATDGNTTCSGRGTCNFATGLCLCETQWSGNNCDQCKSGYFGHNCTQSCKGGAETPCNGHGSCSGGQFGDGSCVCSTGWTGDACNTCDIGYEGPNCEAIPATISQVFPWWSFLIPVVVLVAAAALGLILWKQKKQIENRYRSLENNNPIQLDDDIPVSFPVGESSR